MPPHRINDNLDLGGVGLDRFNNALPAAPACLNFDRARVEDFKPIIFPHPVSTLELSDSRFRAEKICPFMIWRTSALELCIVWGSIWTGLESFSASGSLASKYSLVFSA